MAQTVEASSAIGEPLPLAYGYVQATGLKGPSFKLQNTGDSNVDFTRSKGFILGEGPWDGCLEMWIDDKLIWTSEFDDPTQFHFHAGYDTPIGAGLYPSSTGGDQLVDSFWNDLPDGVNRLAFSRMAYYWIRRKQASDSYSDDKANEDSSWSDWSPLGIWRALRTRIFDASGNVEAFAFNTNPAWHIADVILRRKIQPDYTLDVSGPSALNAAQLARFSWESFYEAANYFSEQLANGRPRFSGNYAFSQRTTLRAILDQMSLCCRSAVQEDAGKIYLITDKARPSYFTLSRSHVQPQDFKPSGQALSSAANHVVAKFRDLLIPAFDATILSIDLPDHGNPVVTFDKDVPADTDDLVVIGGTGSPYDRNWQVLSADGPLVTLKTRGLNYPAHVGAGGKMGLLRTRFMERAPEFPHKAHQKAKGVAGIGLPRVRNRVRVDYDYATCTFDQASRLARYERDRILGPDVEPYAPRLGVSVSAGLFSRDAYGRVLVGARPSARIEVDDLASYDFAGSYALQDFGFSSYSSNASGKSATDAGLASLSLVPYNEGVFYDETDPSTAGYENVPGSDPGNDDDYSLIDLEDGIAAYWTGGDASGATVSIPSLGFNTANVRGWVSPQGTVEANHQLHVIRTLNIDANRKLTLVWSDGNDPASNTWAGDVGYGMLAWRTQHSANVSTTGAMEYVELTLAGGEEVCWGKGIRSGYGTDLIDILTGYDLANSIMLAVPIDGDEVGDNNAHGVRAYVDPAGHSHSDYADGGNVHTWHGRVEVHVFLWKNNMGTWTKDANGWWGCPLATGKRFCVAGFSIRDSRLGGSGPPNFPTTSLDTINDGNFPLPVNMPQRTLQTYATPNSYQNVDHPTHGIKECYVDGDLKALTSFEDGEGHVWYGSMGVFGLVCDVPLSTSGGGTVYRPTAFADSGTVPVSAPDSVYTSGGGTAWLEAVTDELPPMPGHPGYHYDVQTSVGVWSGFSAGATAGETLRIAYVWDGARTTLAVPLPTAAFAYSLDGGTTWIALASYAADGSGSGTLTALLPNGTERSAVRVRVSAICYTGGAEGVDVGLSAITIGV